MTEENETATAVAEAPAKKKKVTAAKKKAVAKKKEVFITPRGRVSAHLGKVIVRLVNSENCGLRSTGKVREAWDSIPNGDNGIKFETYREKAPCGPGLAGRFLALFIKNKLVKMVAKK